MPSKTGCRIVVKLLSKASLFNLSPKTEKPNKTCLLWQDCAIVPTLLIHTPPAPRPGYVGQAKAIVCLTSFYHVFSGTHNY